MRRCGWGVLTNNLIIQRLGRSLGCVGFSSWRRLGIRSLGYRKGCLFGNLGQEMADHSEVFRTRLEEVLSEYRAKIARCFREAQQVGDLRADLDAERLAGFCLNSWEGAPPPHEGRQELRAS